MEVYESRSVKELVKFARLEGKENQMGKNITFKQIRIQTAKEIAYNHAQHRMKS